jgi:hypothetical protein
MKNWWCTRSIWIVVDNMAILYKHINSLLNMDGVWRIGGAQGALELSTPQFLSLNYGFCLMMFWYGLFKMQIFMNWWSWFIWPWHKLISTHMHWSPTTFIIYFALCKWCWSILLTTQDRKTLEKSSSLQNEEGLL